MPFLGDMLVSWRVCVHSFSKISSHVKTQSHSARSCTESGGESFGLPQGEVSFFVAKSWDNYTKDQETLINMDQWIKLASILGLLQLKCRCRSSRLLMNLKRNQLVASLPLPPQQRGKNGIPDANKKCALTGKSAHWWWNLLKFFFLPFFSQHLPTLEQSPWLLDLRANFALDFSTRSKQS